MSAETLPQIGVLLAVALVWLLLNLLASPTWLKVISMAGLLAFLGAASWVALDASGLLP